MSLVVQNIDHPPPSPPGECVVYPRLCWGGGGHTHRAEMRVGGGVNIWKTRNKGLPSYSNKFSIQSGPSSF
jgi:hypothetical protein